MGSVTSLQLHRHSLPNVLAGMYTHIYCIYPPLYIYTTFIYTIYIYTHIILYIFYLYKQIYCIYRTYIHTYTVFILHPYTSILHVLNIHTFYKNFSGLEKFDFYSLTWLAGIFVDSWLRVCTTIVCIPTTVSSSNCSAWSVRPTFKSVSCY